jgi:hypothetical protein
MVQKQILWRPVQGLPVRGKFMTLLFLDQSRRQRARLRVCRLGLDENIFPPQKQQFSARKVSEYLEWQGEAPAEPGPQPKPAPLERRPTENNFHRAPCLPQCGTTVGVRK